MSENKTKRSFNWKALLGALVVIAIFAGFYVLALGLKKWDFKAGTLFFAKDLLLNNFLGINAVLIGLIVFIGYLILGRGFSDSLIGMLKAMIGVLMMQIGSGMIVGLAKPVFLAFSKFGKGLTPLDTYLGQVSVENFLNSVGQGFASWLAYALLIGLTINIILIALRRWTNVHSLMITGHVMFQQAAVVVPVVLVLMFSGQQFRTAEGAINVGGQVGTIFFSGLLLGTYWGVASSSTIKGSDAVTQKAGFCVGHQQMFGIAIAYQIGKFFGKKEDSAETKKLSNKVKLLEDNIFSQSVLILLIFLILILIIQFAPAGASVRFGLSNGLVNKAIYGSWTPGGGAVYWPINLVLGSLQLIAAILTLQAGIRMFVSELQQAFQGISEKLVPGSVVAVDVAATYGFSQNSVTYGFLFGSIGQFLAMGLVIGLAQIPNSRFEIVMVVPLFITLFFNSGSIGVFANASGGYKATIAVPMIFGFVEIIVVALALSMIKNFGVMHQVDLDFQYFEKTLTKADAFKSFTDSLNANSANLFIQGDATKAVSAAQLNDAITNINSQDSFKILRSLSEVTTNWTLGHGKNAKAISLPDMQYLSRYVSDQIAKAKDMKEILKLSSFQRTPFLTGFNGMFDWTCIFGSIMILGGWHPYAAYIVFPLYVVGMIFAAQFFDSHRQHKPTVFQRMLKVKVETLEDQKKAEEVANAPVEEAPQPEVAEQAA